MIQAGAISAATSAAQWQPLVVALRAGGEVVLACHVAPDGDALGSALAVGLALRDTGVQAAVSFGDDPMVVPRSLEHLPGQDLLVAPGALPQRPDVLVAFDTSSTDRLGLLEPMLRGAGASFAVDHHASYTGFADHDVVDAKVPATAVLAADLVDALGAELTPDIATCLYTGLVTDTGSFRYRGTTPDTHALAGRLLATGIAHDTISRLIWDTAPFGYLKLLADALARAELETAAAGGLGLVWTVVPADARRRHGVALDDLEGVIDIVRKASEADVAVVVKEDDGGAYRVSVRSKGRVDVGRLCSALGGGGHRLAAGFTSYDDVAATVAQVRSLLDDGAAEG